jgi:hypothetical protein
MGSGSWSSSTYKAFADSYTKKSREEIFHQRSLHEEMDLTKSKTHIRESRDSEEHPESLPVFIALDETGSMGSIPDKMIRDYLPKLMDSIIDSIGVKHPQILFMGVGDHECDYCPCQVGQFESSTVAINQCLSLKSIWRVVVEVIVENPTYFLGLLQEITRQLIAGKSESKKDSFLQLVMNLL